MIALAMVAALALGQATVTGPATSIAPGATGGPLTLTKNRTINAISTTLMLETDGATIGAPSIDLKVDLPDGGGWWYEPGYINLGGCWELNQNAFDGSLAQTLSQYCPLYPDAGPWAVWLDQAPRDNAVRTQQPRVNANVVDVFSDANYQTLQVHVGQDTQNGPNGSEGIKGSLTGLEFWRASGLDGFAGDFVISNNVYLSSTNSYAPYLDDVTNDGWYEEIYGGTAFPSAEKWDLSFCLHGANPRTCTNMLKVLPDGSVTANGPYVPGVVLVTCAAAYEGALATKASDGATTNTKTCTCVRTSGNVFKWVSRDDVTGTILATGNTTTCN